jgi:uncharacterized protein (DUF1800 family)
MEMTQNCHASACFRLDPSERNVLKIHMFYIEGLYLGSGRKISFMDGALGTKKMKKLCYSLILSLSIANSGIFTSGSCSQLADGDEKVVHLLNRMTFGARPGDIARVKQMGQQAFINEQLSPSSLKESAEVADMEAANPASHKTPIQLINAYKNFKKNQKEQQAIKKAQGDTGEELKKLENPFKEMDQQFIATKLARDTESPRQLQEVMTEFWFNHFNVCITKGLDRVLVGPYEQQAIRPFALGKFRDLLGATCQHPAMLFYLDNWQNTAPQSRGAQGKFNGLNENYARELMELHTLGVNGGYTQKDVTELARVLTGLGIAGPRQARRLQPIGPFGAYFDQNRHDFSTKVILGTTISGSGEQEIEQALDMLARHPSTAHHISYQLAQYFVSDEPPVSLVNKLSACFTRTDGDITAVLRELFSSSEFWDKHYLNAKYKTPLRYAVSALRASDAHPTNYKPIVQFLRLQGEPVYAHLTPDGYKNTEDAWLSPDSLVSRINFATALSSAKMPAVLPEAPEYTQLSATISNGQFSKRTKATLAKAPMALKSAVLLGSPDFMHY